MASSPLPSPPTTPRATTKKTTALPSTTNAIYGLDLRALQNARTSLQGDDISSSSTNPTTTGGMQFRSRPPRCQRKPSAKTGTTTPYFPFLYQRTSDAIGQGSIVTPPPPPLVQQHSSGPDDEERKEEKDTDDDQATKSDDSSEGREGITRVDAERYLQAYRHCPKQENPLYRTSQNVIGSKPPSTATLVAEQHTIQQSFSNSFGRVLYSNQSLNTTLARSKVHKDLDPHFL